MSAERGAASNTLEAYRRDLVDYSSFLKSRGTAVERALPEDVSAYASGLEAAGLKGTTIQRRLSAVRQLHRFLFAEQLSRDNPATSTSAAKPVAALPIVMTESESRACWHRRGRRPRLPVAGSCAPYGSSVSSSCFMPRVCACRSWSD